MTTASTELIETGRPRGAGSLAGRPPVRTLLHTTPPAAQGRLDNHVDNRRRARICSTRFIGAIGARCIRTIGMVYPGTLFIGDNEAFLHGMHSYESRSQIQAL
jgi:hypothetical protein